MPQHTTRFLTASLLAVCITSVASAETPYTLDWVSQIGTSGDDISQSVAVDAAGNTYITGSTTGNLGSSNLGGLDVFLSKFDAAGNAIWTKQIGTPNSVGGGNDEASYAVAVDALGNAYISGYTTGDMDGTNAGSFDAFLTKFDSAGNTNWTKQLGTSSADVSFDLAVDTTGNAYLSGYTFGSLGGTNAGSGDAFLSKFDSAGNTTWTKQVGTSSRDISLSVAIDSSGNAFISGYTAGNMEGANAGPDDAFLTKFDSAGNTVWTKQVGTASNDNSTSVATDSSGNIYITGWTLGSLEGTSAGNYDAFLSKFDNNGNAVWTQQLGTAGNDVSFDLAVDNEGNPYITGRTNNVLGIANEGGNDVYLIKFDANGNTLWAEQLGTTDNDNSYSVTVDGYGNAYISGYTEGDLEGNNAGGQDAFLAKYSVPEPSSLALLAFGGLGLLRRRRSA